MVDVLATQGVGAKVKPLTIRRGTVPRVTVPVFRRCIVFSVCVGNPSLMLRSLTSLLLTALLAALLASCHGSLRCDLGAPRWIKPTKGEVSSHTVPREKRAHFDLVCSFTKGDKGFAQVRRVIQEGDVIAFRMTNKEKRDGILRGNLKTVSYMVYSYAHLAITVRDPDRPDALLLFTSQAARGPNTMDGLDELENHTIDIYRLNRWRQMDRVRLREFVAISLRKANKVFGYNFAGMVGLWSNCLEPHIPSEVGDDYLCSTAVAAALHYAGLDLDAVRCCEALNMISPWRVVTSTGRMMPHSEMVTSPHRTRGLQH